MSRPLTILCVLLAASVWSLEGGLAAFAFGWKAACFLGMIWFPVYFPTLTSRVTLDSRVPDELIVLLGWILLTLHCVVAIVELS